MERRITRDSGRFAAGVDAGQNVRPGVPRERLDGPDPGAHWERPAQQGGVEVLSRSGLRSATPVFGTAQPARGLSGAIRRAAYRVPEHRATRWVLLVAADRVDVLEHRAARGIWILPAMAAAALGYAIAARLRR